MQPGKVGQPAMSAQVAASLQWGPGYATGEGVKRLLRSDGTAGAFNGAPVMQPGTETTQTDQSLNGPCLRWGPGYATGEGARAAACRRAARSPSMGPRLCN